MSDLDFVSCFVVVGGLTKAFIVPAVVIVS